jgi:hypothetical protein
MGLLEIAIEEGTEHSELDSEWIVSAIETEPSEGIEDSGVDEEGGPDSRYRETFGETVVQKLL